MYQIEADETVKHSLIDRTECLVVCIELFLDVKNHKELSKRIDDLFADKEGCVVFSSIHRAKGLENGRVFILEPDILPLVWENQKEWQYEQGVNIKYVALTRSKRELILLTHKPQYKTRINAGIEEARRRAEIFSRLYG